MGDRELREQAIQAAVEIDERFEAIGDLAVAEQGVAGLPAQRSVADKRIEEIRRRTEERIARLWKAADERVAAVEAEFEEQEQQARIAHHDAWAAAKRFWKPAVLTGKLRHTKPVGRRPKLSAVDAVNGPTMDGLGARVGLDSNGPDAPETTPVEPYA
jgi:hypothetical protein